MLLDGNTGWPDRRQEGDTKSYSYTTSVRATILRLLTGYPTCGLTARSQ